MEQKYTDKQLEAAGYFMQAFSKAYYLQMHVKLTTVQQIIDVIKAGTFTFEDVFNTHLDSALKYSLDYEDNVFLDDHMERFDVENYFPYRNKQLPDGGAWIKVQTATGFEVHFAKTTNRKRRYEEEMRTLNQRFGILKRQMESYIEKLKDNTEKVDNPYSKKLDTKFHNLKNKLIEITIRHYIDLPLYEVRIQRTKSKVEYLLPYQYEIISDIDEFADGYINDLPGIHTKKLYSSNNKDAVFYLTSRGISKRNAEMMATLKQTYFIVNMEEAITAYNKMWKESVVIVER